MITHIVFFRMRESAEGRTRTENTELLLSRLRALPQHIPQIAHLEAGVDFSDSAASYDVALITRFANEKDLEAYRVHPEHQKVVNFIQQTTSERAVVDYTTE